MNRISQIIVKILIIFLLIQTINIPLLSYAADDAWKDILDTGDAFIDAGKDAGGDSVIDNSKVQTEFNKIYNILFALGVVLTVIVGAALGIKYMFGSIEDQAKVKETLIPYVAGCIVVYGAFGIWKLIITLLSSI